MTTSTKTEGSATMSVPQWIRHEHHAPSDALEDCATLAGNEFGHHVVVVLILLRLADGCRNGGVARIV